MKSKDAKYIWTTIKIDEIKWTLKKGSGLNTSNKNIYQIKGDVFEMYGFLDYLKDKYPIIKDKYLMIEIMAVNASNTLLDSVFIKLCYN